MLLYRCIGQFKVLVMAFFVAFNYLEVAGISCRLGILDLQTDAFKTIILVKVAG